MTVVHHRETPLRLQKRTVDVGPVWATEAAYALLKGLPVEIIEPGPDLDQRQRINYYICKIKTIPQSGKCREIFPFHGDPIVPATSMRKYGFIRSKRIRNPRFFNIRTKRRCAMNDFNPEQALCETRREFGEHGGVTPSISRSSTFTVIDPETMPEIFGGIRGPEQGGCFLYSRHFNPTVDILARYLSAMEGTEFAVCTASGMSAISCALLQLCKKVITSFPAIPSMVAPMPCLKTCCRSSGLPPPLWTPPTPLRLKMRSPRKPACCIRKPSATPR
jgi:hypothetical protein